LVSLKDVREQIYWFRRSFITSFDARAVEIPLVIDNFTQVNHAISVSG
jgi:hypothetical protein